MHERLPDWRSYLKLPPVLRDAREIMSQGGGSSSAPLQRVSQEIQYDVWLALTMRLPCRLDAQDKHPFIERAYEVGPRVKPLP
jgi:hypothetical protein